MTQKRTQKTSSKKPAKASTDKRLAIEIYVDDCKNLLGLKDWKIVYKVCEEPAKEAEADIAPAHGKIAYLRLNKSFFTFSPEYQRNVICHELLHVHLMGIDDCVLSTRESLGGAAYSILDNMYNEACENAVQSLSHLLETLMPLPDWK